MPWGRLDPGVAGIYLCQASLGRGVHSDKGDQPFLSKNLLLGRKDDIPPDTLMCSRGRTVTLRTHFPPRTSVFPTYKWGAVRAR